MVLKEEFFATIVDAYLWLKNRAFHPPIGK
jgi:hypothetical protein